MPRRARHLIPTQLPRRGEVVAGSAVLVLVAHLLFAQLTLVLAVVFAAVSKTTRWRLWWLAVPAAAGLAWTLAIGPRAAAAGFAAGPAQILAYLGGTRPAGHLLHPHGAFAGIGDWLPRQFPLALIAAAAEAGLAGWLAWVHTDEWAVRPPRPGALAAARGELARRATLAGAVVTRDGCVLGVAPDSGARVVLRWSEMAGGTLAAGADARTLAVSSLQVVHAALRRRKPLIALDLSDGALAGVLGAACRATGTPLRAAGESQDGHWLGHEPDETLLARVVRERSAALLSLRTPGAAVEVCTGILSLGENLRRIGADGDGLVWLYGYAPSPDGPDRLGGMVASLVAGGATAGLPVLVTTTSPRAITDLADLVSVLLVHRLANLPAADILAARTGTRLVPAGWSPRARTTPAPPVQPAPAIDPAGSVPVSDVLGQTGYMEPAASMHPGAAIPPGVTVHPAAGHPAVMMLPGAAMAHFAGMPPTAPPASGLVAVPAVPARALLSLGPAEFVLAVSSPRCRLVKLGQAVPARLPRGATP